MEEAQFGQADQHLLPAQEPREHLDLPQRLPVERRLVHVPLQGAAQAQLAGPAGLGPEQQAERCQPLQPAAHEVEAADAEVGGGEAQAKLNHRRAPNGPRERRG